jgi:hypothetical protein
MVFLLLSLATAGFAWRAFVASFTVGVPTETETVTMVERTHDCDLAFAQRLADDAAIQHHMADHRADPLR